MGFADRCSVWLWKKVAHRRLLGCQLEQLCSCCLLLATEQRVSGVEL